MFDFAEKADGWFVDLSLSLAQIEAALRNGTPTERAEAMAAFAVLNASLQMMRVAVDEELASRSLRARLVSVVRSLLRRDDGTAADTLLHVKVDDERTAQDREGAKVIYLHRNAGGAA